MPRLIMKLTDDQNKRDYFLEWSTVVDAPVTHGMSFEDFERYYKEQYGSRGSADLGERMSRVNQTGVSSYDDNVSYYLESNRAGDKETTLDKEGLLNKYCRINTSDTP